MGNLKGIPVDVSNEVNRAVMNDDISRVQDIANANGLPADQVLGDPNYFGLSPNAVTRYDNAIRSQDGLIKSADAVDAQGRHPDVFAPDA